MQREVEKTEYERNVFGYFLKDTNLGIDGSSIRHGDPNKGEPDILCKFSNGQEVAFELGRLTDGNLAKVVNSWSPENGKFVRTSDSSMEITKKKLQKTYKVSCPVELILYKEYPIITPEDVIVPTIKPICSEIRHKYQRVWFMGSNSTQLIYENN